VEVVVGTGDGVDRALQVLSEVAVGDVARDEHTRRLTAPVSGGGAVLVEVLRRLDAAGVTVSDAALRRPTLDDVFLSLTGHTAEDDEAAPAGARR
jgi:ABC-2 type transport system ATP-binding protein